MAAPASELHIMRAAHNEQLNINKCSIKSRLCNSASLLPRLLGRRLKCNQCLPLSRWGIWMSGHCWMNDFNEVWLGSLQVWYQSEFAWMGKQAPEQWAIWKRQGVTEHNHGRRRVGVNKLGPWPTRHAPGKKSERIGRIDWVIKTAVSPVATTVDVTTGSCGD